MSSLMVLAYLLDLMVFNKKKSLNDKYLGEFFYQDLFWCFDSFSGFKSICTNGFQPKLFVLDITKTWMKSYLGNY